MKSRSLGSFWRGQEFSLTNLTVACMGTGHCYGLSAALSGGSSDAICSQMPGFAQSYLFLLAFFFFFLPPIFSNTRQENLHKFCSHWSDGVLKEVSLGRPAHGGMPGREGTNSRPASRYDAFSFGSLDRCILKG